MRDNAGGICKDAYVVEGGDGPCSFQDGVLTGFDIGFE